MLVVVASEPPPSESAFIDIATSPSVSTPVSAFINAFHVFPTVLVTVALIPAIVAVTFYTASLNVKSTEMILPTVAS